MGIQCIADIVHENGLFKSPHELLVENIYNKYVMSLNTLLRSIPKDWLSLIRGQIFKEIVIVRAIPRMWQMQNTEIINKN